ncbi:MAG: hypothetical protein O6942_02410, partial [Bacteroidetes bacterium]|nr:hypothetical protein [Bacteroidota bacterium]
DQFHDPVSFDGLPPLMNPTVEVLRSVLVRGDNVDGRGPLPAFSDMDDAYFMHRLPVGPTLKFD